jgi:hypothetical protein
MAFLDNSGDIILDAVLTEDGRKKMADGTFRITKFALGDDEIDYSLYNKNHPSGSAYADLDILQTPIFEAFTQTNAGINYGLLSLTAAETLYLPVLNVNEKTSVTNAVKSPSSPTNGLFYLADTSTDTTTNLLLSTALGSSDKFLASDGASGPAVLLESGLNTSNVAGDAANKTTYLVANNLLDNSFFVYYDNRFITSVLGPSSGAKFDNTSLGLSGTPTLEYTLTTAPPVTTDLQLSNYSSARVLGLNDGVVKNSAYATADTSVSSIAGPRGTFTVLNFSVKPNLSTEYTLYGSVSQDVFGDGKLYSYIDTTVYVQGTRTGAQRQIPLRIIKYISG